MAESQVTIKVAVQGQTSLDRLQQQMNAVDVAAKKVQGNVPKAANNIRAFGGAASGAATSLKGLGAAFVAALGPVVALTSAVALFTKAINTAFEREAAEQKLKNFTDSTEEYEAALASATVIARKFGLTQTEASAALADTYGRLKGLGFGLKETVEIYSGFNAVAKQSGTSAEDAAGAFLQLSQALGSGKLQGDELRAILERMPQLAQLIAQSMGVSAGEIRKLGQEGKITSEVIYKALSQAAGASDDFSDKLTEQQKGFAALRQAADNLFNGLGKVFGPAVVAAAEAFAFVFNKINEFFGYLGQVLLPKVEAAIKPVIDAFKSLFEGVDFEAIGVVIQNTLIKSFTLIVEVIGMAARAFGRLVEFIKASPLTPVLQAAAAAAGFLADKFGLTRDRVGELAQEQQKSTEEAAKTVNQFSSLPEKVEDVKEKQKELNAEYKKATEELEFQQNAISKILAVEKTLLGLATEIALARAQQTFNTESLRAAQTAVTAEMDKQRELDIAAADYQLLKIGLQEKYGQLTKQQAATQREVVGLELEAAQAVATQTEAKKQIDLIEGSIASKLEKEVGFIDRNLQATQGLLQAQSQLLGVYIQQEQSALNAAKTQEDRNRIANNIYQLTVQQAALEREAAQAAIEAEVRKAALALQNARLKEQELLAAANLASAQGRYNELYAVAIDNQREAVSIASAQLQTTREIADYQTRVADQTFVSKVEAAQLALELERGKGAAEGMATQMERVAAATLQAGNLAGLLKTQFGEAANNLLFSAAYAAELNELQRKGVTGMGEYNKLQEKYLSLARKINEEAYRRNILQAKAALMEGGLTRSETAILQSIVRTNNSRSGGYRVPYAEGGYVTKPTKALIGEGGEPEYVIPSSKMEAAMRNYGMGRRGEAVLSPGNPQVNVTTGPVMRMDGKDYVSKGELTTAMTSAVNQTIRMITSTPSLRRQMGVAR